MTDASTSNASPSTPKPTTSATPISNLPQPHRFITTHNPSGQAIVHSHAPFAWSAYDNNNLAFAVPYTTSTFPADLNNDADITQHEHTIASGQLGLVNPRGTVLRCVDFAPGYACGMHRTQSLDYGIVMEGEVDMVLDSGERYTLKRGDVAVQRATQHQWVNRSGTEWARMMFVLQDCRTLVVGGREMGEDLGTNSGLPASGNSGE
ncbi:hypothetical protein C8A01DRAFT_13136 [Parachaetomium inaequale]|uniref:Cupin type-2 domain-containing protein n=1 Tax=Parachaetomium inaequale TaxID=2588326 RepID=A0AAN6SV92_9PEZI|nr:hypothetical protein C8A01DRAFT_13136 [Parachaetomium inaequale]